MRIGKLKLGLIATAALGASLPLLMATTPAYADYAPTTSDVVGAGSDTLQYMLDFTADGFPGTSGYNGAGNKNKLVSIDATADSNARLAYGNSGVGTGQCGPGTGGTAGTGNQATTHADKPCVLNPTVVLRAGTDPVLRPNGSGAGYSAMANDIGALHLGGTGAAATREVVNFNRASSQLGAGGKNLTNPGGNCPTGGDCQLDSVQLGTEVLGLLVNNDSNGTNAVQLSAPQLKTIYTASSPSCVLWNQVGGTSADPVIPFIPQVGSGTRSTFESDIGVTDSTLGTCVETSEENDPTALDQASFEPTQTHTATVVQQDAIEPMSSARLNLFIGQQGNPTSATGATTANALGPYFLDPSCPVETTATNCTNGTKNHASNTNVINTQVQIESSSFNGGTPPSDTNALFAPTRGLYIYFRDNDISSTTAWQPGGLLSWLRTLFYNPCDGVVSGTCVTVGGITYGPGGPPYVATSPGMTQLELAGVTPADTFTAAGP